jgi:ABC-type oligopeptide transport system substrate-binding subunit
MLTMNRKIKPLAAALVAALFAGGCAHHSSSELGAAVRHMTEQQTYNLDAAHNPDPEPPMGGNADRLNDVVDSHRNNAEDPTEDRGALAVIGL